MYPYCVLLLHNVPLSSTIDDAEDVSCVCYILQLKKKQNNN